MIQIITVNGFPESGKSTFEQFCLDYLGPYGGQISTVDFVKEIATMAGWDGTKTLKNRKFLSDLKDLLTEWDDVPVKKIQEYCKRKEDELRIYDVDDQYGYIFVDSREPWEIERFRHEMGAKAVLIRRPGDQQQNMGALNHADQQVLAAEYDYVIQNNGDLDDLKVKAELFVNGLRETLKREQNNDIIK